MSSSKTTRSIDNINVYVLRAICPWRPGHHGERIEAALVQHLPLDGGDVVRGRGRHRHHIPRGERHSNDLPIFWKAYLFLKMCIECALCNAQCAWSKGKQSLRSQNKHTIHTSSLRIYLHPFAHFTLLDCGLSIFCSSRVPSLCKSSLSLVAEDGSFTSNDLICHWSHVHFPREKQPLLKV